MLFSSVAAIVARAQDFERLERKDVNVSSFDTVGRRLVLTN